MTIGAEATSLRVKKSTRDKLAEYGKDHDMTADEVVNAGIRALEWAAKRKRVAHQMRVLSRDPEYIAEMRAVQEDLHGPVAVEEQRAAG
jgi:hypothetical protein